MHHFLGVINHRIEAMPLLHQGCYVSRSNHLHLKISIKSELSPQSECETLLIRAVLGLHLKLVCHISCMAMVFRTMEFGEGPTMISAL